MSRLIFDIAQNIETTRFGVPHQTLQSTLVDCVNVDDDQRRMMLHRLFNSHSGHYLSNYRPELTQLPTHHVTHDIFLQCVHDYIMAWYEVSTQHTMRDYPDLEPECYTPPPEQIERENEMQTDILHAIGL